MDALTDFHFLRPLWFMAILPLAWLGYCLWKKRSENTGLETHISKNLLSHLISGENRQRSPLPIFGLLILWLMSVVALAGPTWEKIPQPLVASDSAVVIVLDLSPSMRAEDLKPSRIIRAHLKIQDFLSRRKEGLTALIVYAGEAYVVTPLSDDTKTISNLLPTLKPGILPIPGSNVEMALALATELVKDVKLAKASVLLITDSIDKSAESEIVKQLPASLSLTILGVGSDEGAPIPNNGDFLKDKSGNVIVAKRNSETMESITSKVNGYYLPIQADTADIDFYYRQLEQQFANNQTDSEHQRQYDNWHELGPSLLALLIPVVALIFKRGLIIALCSLLIGFGGFLPSNVYAASWWDSLWKNSDQRALEAYEQEQYDGAAETFNSDEWKGSAYYKNNDYSAALDAFSKSNTAIADYNQGNALANLQRYDDAIAAYTRALEKKPNFEEAKTNKKRVEDLKKKEEEQQEQEKSDKQKNQDQQSKKSEEQEKQNNEGEDQEDQGSQGNKDSEKNEQQQSNGEQSKPDEQQGSSKEDKPDSENSNQENDDKDESNSENIAETERDKLSNEEQQALQQWLRKVPDDPSGLLKRKFEYEFQKRRQLYQRGEWQLPENNAHQRY